MLTKILFTLGVVALVIALVRFRDRPARRPDTPKAMPPRLPWVRPLAVAVVAVMLLASVVAVYLQWRDSHQVMQVQVIDSGTGRRSTYRVYRGELQERRFVTLDGRVVQLAETERLEVKVAP